ncbi:sulfatase-like hydrolase/transferase [Akkermansiaceae bacterium]|nr:sulfatase-like hydrolase/transferase [Akkermansiaceae bacterium]
MTAALIKFILMLAFGISALCAVEKPNITFLFADDQRADTIGAHGNPDINTPNIDQLAGEGFSFRRNYCVDSFSDPKINHRFLFDLESDPHEITNLAESGEHLAEVKWLETLMGGWRDRLGDVSPLSVDQPEAMEVTFDNSKRKLDVWQLKWIRGKYFDGREKTDHGKK